MNRPVDANNVQLANVYQNSFKFSVIMLLFSWVNIAQTKLNSTTLNFLVTDDTLENFIQGFRQTFTCNHVFWGNSDFSEGSLSISFTSESSQFWFLLVLRVATPKNVLLHGKTTKSPWINARVYILILISCKLKTWWVVCWNWNVKCWLLICLSLIRTTYHVPQWYTK